MSDGGHPLRSDPAVAAFLSEGAEVHLPPGRSPTASMVAKMAMAAGIGATISFTVPTFAASLTARKAHPAPISAVIPDIPGQTAWANSDATPGMGRELPLENLSGNPRMVDIGFDNVPLRPSMPDDINISGTRISREVAAAIVDAARTTGADPVLMMAVADKESGFNTNARPTTSSALGLYQFLDMSWLSAIKDFGAKHGLMEEAAAVRAVDGQLVVSDPAVKAKILEMRKDPVVSSLMACETHLRAKAALRTRFGSEPTPTQSYLAHFMGTNGAGKLIQAVQEKPHANAVNLFKKAAEANPAIFREGPLKRPRSVQQVSDTMTRMVQKRVDKFVDIEEKMDAGAALMMMR